MIDVMNSAATLSPTQAHAVKALGSVMKYRTATELELAPATLQSLVRLGLVQEKSYRVQSSNPRARVSNEPIIRSYRNSHKGYSLSRGFRVDGFTRITF